jgi:hypothetical protein
MQKLILALLSLNLLFISVHADQTGFDLKETKGQYLDVTNQGKLVGRYMISRDSALEKSREIFFGAAEIQAHLRPDGTQPRGASDCD